MSDVAPLDKASYSAEPEAPRCANCGRLIHLRVDEVRISTTRKQVTSLGLRAVTEALAAEVRPFDDCVWPAQVFVPGLAVGLHSARWVAVTQRHHLVRLPDDDRQVHVLGSVLPEPEPDPDDLPRPQITAAVDGDPTEPYIVVSPDGIRYEVDGGTMREIPTAVQVGIDVGGDDARLAILDVATGEVV